MMFFESKHNLNLIDEYIDCANEYIDEHDGEIRKRIEISIKVATSIRENPKKWDEMCNYNINNGLDISLLNNRYGKPNVDGINDIFYFYVKLFYEFDLRDNYSLEILGLRYLKHDILNDIKDPIVASEIFNIAYVIPMKKLDNFINCNETKELFSFNNKLADAKKEKYKWQQEIESYKKEAKSLSLELKNLSSGFNFVGLFDGFKSLSEDKYKEIANVRKILFFIGGALLIIPFIFEMYMMNSIHRQDFSLINMMMYIPVISIEFLLIYFFRIVLMNYNSIKAQIIQIELRKTLCRFIQRYAEYAADIKEKHNISLEKFENLIFSGIVSDSEKLPSTFDGLEQMGAFIKSITNK
ncbi:hypothetical protein WAX87_07285 [Photobacterium damselae subsp. damselae]|uniref:hypothetical protein n=1 Tax=Photobacterium damselae TaxID=38293 RepID=UPI00311AD796